MKRLGRLVLSLALVWALCGAAFAADTAAVVGVEIGPDSAGLFLTGGPAEGMTAKISDWECETRAQGSLEQVQIGTRTLFLIDTSTSMRSGSRRQVVELLHHLVENKAAGDEYAIATFGEQYQLQAAFTGERYDLAKAVDALEWKDQQSSIYHAVQAAVQAIHKDDPGKPAFEQLVLFSDGVEKSESGIIKEELFFGLRDAPLPVHTIGFQYENNADGLKELYAISRITGGIRHEVGAETDILEAAEELSGYAADIHYIQLVLPEPVKDGAVRPLELIGPGGESVLRHDLHMPRVEAAAVPEVAPEPETEPASTPAEPAGPDNRALLLIGLVAVVVAGGAAALMVVRKRRKPEAKPEDRPGSDTEFWSGDDNHTQLLIPDEQLRGAPQYRLVLNDLEQPHVRFESVVESTVEIGREPGEPGITIDYDKRISKRHCAVTKRDGGLWIEDLGSTNKTFVNDELVRSPRILRDNDVLACGKARFSVRIEKR